MKRSVLLLSNGHGEDVIGAVLARALEGFPLRAFPLVGLGEPYQKAGIPVVGRQKLMPTGGFIRQGLRFLWRDVKAGLLSLTRAQIRVLIQLRGRTGLVIAVGDVYPLWLAGRYLRRPLVFLPTAKSEYISGHYGFEVRMMRKYCQLVFPRDEKTARALRRQGVPAEYCGNLMMDCLQPSRRELGLPERELIGILPGSRQEAYENLARILQAVTHLEKKSPGRFSYAVAKAGSLSFAELSARVAAEGWQADGVSEEKRALGIEGKLVYRSEPGLEVFVVAGRFSDIIDRALLVIGMAGTANEQAAGLGTPVIAFPGEGPQFTRGFLRAQARLLGEALAAVDSPREAAEEALAILSDVERYRRMQEAGRERMGQPGGAEKMAARIKDLISELDLGIDRPITEDKEGDSDGH